MRTVKTINNKNDDNDFLNNDANFKFQRHININSSNKI